MSATSNSKTIDLRKPIAAIAGDVAEVCALYFKIGTQRDLAMLVPSVLASAGLVLAVGLDHPREEVIFVSLVPVVTFYLLARTVDLVIFRKPRKPPTEAERPPKIVVPAVIGSLGCALVVATLFISSVEFLFLGPRWAAVWALALSGVFAAAFVVCMAFGILCVAIHEGRRIAIVEFSIGAFQVVVRLCQKAKRLSGRSGSPTGLIPVP